MTHAGVFTRLLTVLAIGLAGCFLAGCSNQGSGNDPPSGAADPTDRSPTPELSMSGGYVVGPDGHLLKPSDGPEPQPPASPTSIGDNTPEAAEEFARYFIAVTEYAWNTGDTALLQKISAEDCIICNQMTKAVEERYESGGWTDGLKYVVANESSSQKFPDTANKYAILLQIKTSTTASYSEGELSSVKSETSLVEVQACFAEHWIVCGGGSTDADELSENS
jgi:hypothetical protein